MSAEELAVEPLAAARRVLGATLWSGPVGVRIVEVEAYGVIRRGRGTIRQRTPGRAAPRAMP